MRNRDLMVYATIKQTDLLSGHGDQSDLLNTVKQQDPKTLKKVFLVHGDIKCLHDLSAALEQEHYQVEIPKKGDTYEL
ncbi:RNA-metabolising metallo-beta-lactamase [compost metagenome]